MHPTSLILRVLALAVSLLFALNSAQATSVTEQTFPDLVHRAEVIAVGTVTDIREQWWDAERKTPVTLVTFSNLTMLKGSTESGSLTLQFLGGHTPEGKVLAIAGVPRFTLGEKTVVFCAGNGRSFSPLVGVWQGLLRVTMDPQRREEIVRDSFHTPILGIQNGRFVKLSQGTPTQDALSLSALVQSITQELRSSYVQP
jgi:hypothetical protein